MSKAQSIARMKMLTEPGHLYAVYSRYCDWVKIGFSTKVDERLENIAHQYDEFAPFTLIGKTVSTYRAEQQLHRALEPFRQRHTGRTRELYPAVPPLVQTVKNVLSWREWKPMPWEQWKRVSGWAREAARKPLVKTEAIISYERFYAERVARLQQWHSDRRAA